MVWNIDRTEIMGKSGFKVNYKVGGGKHWRTNPKQAVAEVKNIDTEEILFKLTYNRGYKTSRSANPSIKTFFGLDNRYYHVSVSVANQEWGQIQSDGSVIDSKRSVIKYLNFYPMEVTPTTIPTSQNLKSIIKPPAVPVVSAIPAVISAPKFTDFKDTKTEEISWIKKIQNLIQKIKIWIINLLNR